MKRGCVATAESGEKMQKILESMTGKQGGIPLILAGAALLVLMVVPAKLLMMTLALAWMVGGMCVYKRTGK